MTKGIYRVTLVALRVRLVAFSGLMVFL